MEKEKNVTARTGNEVKENVNEVTEVKEVKTKAKLILERETFVGNDGKEYYSYLLKGKIKDRSIKVDFAPKDKGGYEVLDIVFEFGGDVELIMLEETMTSVDGKKTKYMTYTAKSIDTDGLQYECGVKPSRDSDKALLKMLLNQLGGTK